MENIINMLPDEVKLQLKKALVDSRITSITERGAKLVFSRNCFYEKVFAYILTPYFKSVEYVGNKAIFCDLIVTLKNNKRVALQLKTKGTKIAKLYEMSHVFKMLKGDKPLSIEEQVKIITREYDERLVRETNEYNISEIQCLLLCKHKNAILAIREYELKPFGDKKLEDIKSKESSISFKCDGEEYSFRLSNNILYFNCRLAKEIDSFKVDGLKTIDERVREAATNPKGKINPLISYDDLYEKSKDYPKELVDVVTIKDESEPISKIHTYVVEGEGNNNIGCINYFYNKNKRCVVVENSYIKNTSMIYDELVNHGLIDNCHIRQNLVFPSLSEAKRLLNKKRGKKKKQK